MWWAWRSLQSIHFLFNSCKWAGSECLSVKSTWRIKKADEESRACERARKRHLRCFRYYIFDSVRFMTLVSMLWKYFQSDDTISFLMTTKQISLSLLVKPFNCQIRHFFCNLFIPCGVVLHPWSRVGIFNMRLYWQNARFDTWLCSLLSWILRAHSVTLRYFSLFSGQGSSRAKSDEYLSFDHHLPLTPHLSLLLPPGQATQTN